MMDLSRDTVDGCESQRNPELIGGKHLIILSWAFKDPVGAGFRWPIHRISTRISQPQGICGLDMIGSWRCIWLVVFHLPL